MSDIVKGTVAPGYERVKEIYQQVSASNNTKHSLSCYSLQDFFLHVRVRACSIPHFASQDFARGSDASSQVCVYVKGERVVDLWGSHGPKGDPNYGPDSLQVTDLANQQHFEY